VNSTVEMNAANANTTSQIEASLERHPGRRKIKPATMTSASSNANDKATRQPVLIR